jgi:nitronate monooxygenase
LAATCARYDAIEKGRSDDDISKPFNVHFFCHAPFTPSAEREVALRAALAPYYKEYGIDVDSIPAGPGRAPFSSKAADVLSEFKPAVVSFHLVCPPPSCWRA